MSEWFEDFFDEVANDFWEAAVPPESTAADVTWLTGALSLRPGMRVLDVPSGRGRHALALAGLGMDVVAVDGSADAVAHLTRRAADAALTIDVRHGDMRRLEGITAEAAYCFGNSLGYFPIDDVARFTAAVADALPSGGRLAIDTSVVAECLLPHVGPSDSHEAGGVTVTDRSTYDARASRLDTEMTFERGGQRSVRTASHHVFTTRELVTVLGDSGFGVTRLDGDTDGAPFAVGAGRLLLVAERR